MKTLLAVAVLLLAVGAARASGLDDIPFEDIPRPGGPRDMEILRAMMANVEVLSATETGLVSAAVPRNRLSTQCPRCIAIDGRHYLADWDALMLFNVPAGVQNCTAAAAEGAAVDVKRSELFACRKASGDDKGENHSATIGYTLSRLKDGIHVRTKVRFTMDGAGTAMTPALSARMLAKARACLPLVRKFWQRYGLSFDLSLDSDDSPEAGAPDVAVRLIDTTQDVKQGRRSNQSKYYLRASEDADFCKLMLHETGHNLGLDDEYAESTCPDRTFVAKESNPWSVMADEYHDPADIQFFPRHLRRVLGPLCRRP